MISKPTRLWLHREDGGRNILRNVGILTHYYTASQPRRPRHKFRKQWTAELFCRTVSRFSHDLFTGICHSTSTRYTTVLCRGAFTWVAANSAALAVNPLSALSQALWHLSVCLLLIPCPDYPLFVCDFLTTSYDFPEATRGLSLLIYLLKGIFLHLQPEQDVANGGCVHSSTNQLLFCER
jgi:hypothetical protein